MMDRIWTRAHELAHQFRHFWAMERPYDFEFDSRTAGWITYIIHTDPEKPKSAKTLPCPQVWALEKRIFDHAVKEFHHCIDRLERFRPLQQNINPATVRDLFSESTRQADTSFERRTRSKRDEFIPQRGSRTCPAWTNADVSLILRRKSRKSY